MIRLQRITLREIHLPLVERFRTAGGTVEARRILLLELEDADGTRAWSECVAEAVPTYAPETVDTCRLAIREWLVPRLLGRELAAPDEASRVLGRGIRGHPMARAAVEMAVWALFAERRDLPLARLLADASAMAHERGEKPREFVHAGIALGMQESPAAAAERARTARAEGYRRIKLKVEPGCDVEYVRAVREALGPDVPLTADGNGSYALDDAAHLRALQALDAFGLAMLEQPLAPGDLRRHAELQRRLTTPICLDESVGSDADAEDMIALGSAQVLNLKPGRVGGLAEAIAIHDRCAGAGVRLWCGGMLECGIGRAYNVALAALPGFTDPGDLSPSARYWARDVVTPAWTMDAEGRVRVPLDRPGLGVEVDVDAIDDLTASAETLRAR